MARIFARIVLGRWTLHKLVTYAMIPGYEQAYPFSPDDGPATPAVVRDLGSDRRRGARMSHRPCRAPHLLRLETTLPRRRVCRALSVCQSGAQAYPADGRL